MLFLYNMRIIELFVNSQNAKMLFLKNISFPKPGGDPYNYRRLQTYIFSVLLKEEKSKLSQDVIAGDALITEMKDDELVDFFRLTL